MPVNPYLNFDGTCEEAFRLYEKALGGRIDMMLPFAMEPGTSSVPESWRGKIMHAAMTIGDTALMGSDGQQGGYTKPQGFSVSFIAASVEQAESAFKALSEGGDVRMPMAETFFSKRFGMVTDRFGIPWMINFPAQ
ncbi:MAG: VOC family protein [Alphaproteobacteria bacterium]|nr:VOC family protein [Alphaproteobacteria bacterium]